jgi:hypothetical protein
MSQEQKPIKEDKSQKPVPSRDVDWSRKGEIRDRKDENLTTDWLKPPPPKEKGA